MKKMTEKKLKRCENCKHHFWLNGWRCRLVRWEFQLFLPVNCDHYEE